jgi:hypothetical protein
LEVFGKINTNKNSDDVNDTPVFIKPERLAYVEGENQNSGILQPKRVT